ncbi:MAG: M48 family metalloprotease [Acidobacteriota bacterium]
MKAKPTLVTVRTGAAGLAVLALTGSLALAQTKSQLEAAANYDRGLVFLQQGAYKEAEQALRQAERRDDKNLDYQFAVAYAYLKLHRPDDALKRYQRIYKNDPTNLRAIVGLAATYEEMLNHREAVRMWQRYAKMDLPPREREEAAELLRTAQDLFVREWEIAENPAGGAPNAASRDEEREWGLQFAREMAASGIPLVQDAPLVAYVAGLCQRLVAVAKGFPREYELFVLDSPAVNAQTVPGFIFVYRGILETVQSETELAGVLAHELAHSMARHAGKSVTRAAQDQQTLEALQRQDSALARFLARLMALSNPIGQLAFSREQESQADRIAIHVLWDAGFDPRGLASLFRRFESIEPSSRRSWDLMTKTHPFSIDRMNAVNDYVTLFPDRAFPSGAAAPFSEMKARLAALPPPPTPAPSTAPAASADAAGGTVPFTLDDAPFSGEIPATWVARKTESGTIVFEGRPGTEAYEATVELEIASKASLPGRSAADIADVVYQGTSSKPNARMQRPEPRGGAYTLGGTYEVQAGQRAVRVRHVSVIGEYPGYFVILSYFAPDSLFDKYVSVFQQIAESFRYTGR